MAVKIIKFVPGNWRVVLRFSLDYDRNSSVRNHIAPLLEQCGIRRTRTGTWESRDSHADPATASKQLARVLKVLSAPQSWVGSAGPHAELDHFWLYMDRVR